MTGEAIDWRTPFDEVAAMEEERPEAADPLEGVIIRHVEVLAEFCSHHPNAWETLKARLRNPCASYAELARELGIGKMTVHDHLKEAAAVCKRAGLATRNQELGTRNAKR